MYQQDFMLFRMIFRLQWRLYDKYVYKYYNNACVLLLCFKVPKNNICSVCSVIKFILMTQIAVYVASNRVPITSDCIIEAQRWSVFCREKIITTSDFKKSRSDVESRISGFKVQCHSIKA